MIADHKREGKGKGVRGRVSLLSLEGHEENGPNTLSLDRGTLGFRFPSRTRFFKRRGESLMRGGETAHWVFTRRTFSKRDITLLESVRGKKKKRTFLCHGK